MENEFIEDECDVPLHDHSVGTNSYESGWYKNESVIPPTIHLDEQDENCDLNCVPNTAVEADITLALSNSLGFGGHNACLAFRKV